LNTLPKHPKTSRYVQSGIFNDLKTFSQLEKRISKLKTEKERGDAFEVFTEGYLGTQSIMRAKEVWPFEKIPRPLKQKFRLDQAQDMGVDGLLQTTTDEHHAYQVKFRTNRPTLTWTELSTFIGLSDKTDQKLVFTNCDKLSKTVEDREDVFCVRGVDLDRLTPEDFDFILSWLKKHPKPKPKKTPRDYQQEALDAIYEGLTNGRRATSVMACGTGKTILALWTAEKLGYKKILVLVPSLALLSQTLHEWMQETSWENFSYICVCSDPMAFPPVGRSLITTRSFTIFITHPLLSVCKSTARIHSGYCHTIHPHDVALSISPAQV
jgi:predicted helicase